MGEEESILYFDLNIGKNYLSDWKISLALREIIANALKEIKEDSLEGTEFRIFNCSKSAVEEAKLQFIKFQTPQVLAKTIKGDVIDKGIDDKASIYLNGMKISEDSNLRFSYNITNPSSTIKKGINRERQYVSRTVYQKDISKILENVDDETVLNKLVEQIERSYEDKVFLEDFEFELKETVPINDLDVNEKKVLEEVVTLLKGIDGLRGELYLLDNVIISKENIAYKNTKENSIVIPREALSTITSCSSSIIDAIASVRHASAQFKNNFIGEICSELFELKNKGI